MGGVHHAVPCRHHRPRACYFQDIAVATHAQSVLVLRRERPFGSPTGHATGGNAGY